MPLFSCNPDKRLQALSTRYTNAVANNTFEAPFTFKKEDGTDGISIPPHVCIGSGLLYNSIQPD